PFLGYQTNVLYWLACWIGNIAMVVIGVGYLSYFFPILKDPLVEALKAGALDYLIKPLDFDRLQETLEKALAHTRETGAELPSA
ncbi:hypothetical protein MJM59_33320, partial [Salmonella enterica subsp. enterica serovar Montevideo]|nr:hypothetical protein [Salmonella enterica subsp. enterica serovar Montevideo]